MSRYLVLKTLPHGQEPGTTVELNDDEARVFLLVEAVSPIADAASAIAESVVEESVTEEPKPRRKYQRRDLVAHTVED